MFRSPWALIWVLEQRSPTGTLLLVGAVIAALFAHYAPAMVGTWLLAAVAGLFGGAALWMFVRGE